MANIWFRSINRHLAPARDIFPVAILAIAQLNRVRLQNRYAKSSNRVLTPCSNYTQKYHKHNTLETKNLSDLSFWGSPHVWKRAGINTFRCLVGCTMGDFSAMWFLQANYPDLGIGTVMATSMAAGLITSMSLETTLLRLGRDGLTWEAAAKTAAGMSLVSMLGMEAVQNVVDYHLTGGIVAFENPQFWTAAVISMLAGFLAPLPYNYVRLRKYGRACH